MANKDIQKERERGEGTTVLLVDNNPGAARYLTVAFDEINGQMKTLVATDEAEAREILRLGQNEIPTQIPAVVVMDIDNDGVDGRNVLRAIREREELDSLPVIVFSREDDPATVEECYDLGATLCVVKSDGYEGLKRIVNAVSICTEAVEVAG